MINKRLTGMYGRLMRPHSTKKRKLRGQKSRHYEGRPAVAAARATGTDVFQVAGSPEVSTIITKGKRSAYNQQAALHENVISVTLTNGSATDIADVILFGGRFADRADVSPRLLTDGTTTVTNKDAGPTTADVTLAADYGVANPYQAWSLVQNEAREKGIHLVGFQMRFQTFEQLRHSLIIEKYQFVANPDLQQIKPSMLQEPLNNDNKLLVSDLGITITKDHILSYRLEPSEVVTFDFFLDATLDLDQILVDYARSQGRDTLS